MSPARPDVVHEARSILRRELERYRLRAYTELVRLVGTCDDYEVRGDSGRVFGVEVQGLWDAGKPGGDLRVIAAIDGCGISSSRPITDDFILRPDGTFIGE